MLNIALPKGRLGNKVYRALEAIGYECPSVLEESRQLVFVNEEKQVSYLLVKPSDVAIYVERGAADLGVVGKDTLTECGADVYELLDLGFGRCRMCVAAKNGWQDDESLPLRVATKYPNIATDYFDGRSRRIDIIKLSGSIELAPILGLSDVIVDIVETGGTLRENDLAVFEEIMPISARLIANKSSYKFKAEQIDDICKRLEETL